MKVLIGAYSCVPGHGSEPGAGAAWVLAATRDHEVWVVTHTANAAVLEPLRAANPWLAQQLHVEYVHLGGRVERLRHMGPLRFAYYAAWQYGPCRRAARRLHAQVGFDVAHHVTYAADWLPAGVGDVPGLPFVWGPVGGSSTRPGLRLAARLGAATLCSELVRLAVLSVLRRTVGRSTAARAAVVLGQNRDVAATFAPVAVTVEPHVAVSPTGDRRTSGKSDGPRRAVFAGRLLGWKGLALAVEALACPVAAGWVLDVYGDGPARRHLERRAARLEVADRITFHGNRPRSEVRIALADADALLFPSTHDAAGWAVAEALAAGCPVVALRVGGPATLVGPDDGILVEPDEDVVAKLAAALDRARGLCPDVDRWRADRLPAVLDRVYRASCATATDPMRVAE